MMSFLSHDELDPQSDARANYGKSPDWMYVSIIAPESLPAVTVPVSPAGLAAGVVPNVPVLTIPARALFCRGVKFGIR